MKKLFVFATLLAVAGCSCMNSEDPVVQERKVIYRSYQPAPAVPVAPAMVAQPAPIPVTIVQPDNCDYVSGNTCYRYVRSPRMVEHSPRRVERAPRYVEPEPYDEPVRVRRPRPRPQPAPEPIEYVDNSPVADGNPGDCAPKYRTTREPVEVVYKKTTYKTVYEPKTTSSVSYEKEPYSGQLSDCKSEPCPVTVAEPAPVRRIQPRKVSVPARPAQPLFEEELTLEELK